MNRRLTNGKTGRFASVVLLSATLCLPIPGAAERAPVDVELRTSRDFGYTIGDLIRHHAVVRSHSDLELDRSHLPVPGARTPWLDLRTISVEEGREDGRNRYDIFLTYQIFKSVTGSEALALPSVPLHFRGGAAEEVAVPAWPFGYAPLIPRRTPDSAVKIRPPREAVPLNTSKHILRLGLFGSGTLLLLAYLAWVYDLVPGLKRHPGPFTRASRKIAALMSQPEGETERRALQTFHQALNETAGKTLFAQELDQFLHRFPRYAGLAEPTRCFFAHSQQVFFGTGAPSDDVFTLAELERLCREYQRMESSLP